MFPSLWMKQVFLAERLVDFPQKVQCLIMGQDPACKESSNNLSNLRSATGVAFHNIGDDHSSIVGMNEKYDLDCTGDKPIQYCRDGLLLVNMIRCIPKDSKSMDANPYHDAWFVYSLKLAKYCGEHNKPVVVMCNMDFKPDLLSSIKTVNDKAKRVQHPSYNVNVKDKQTFRRLVTKSS